MNQSTINSSNDDNSALLLATTLFALAGQQHLMGNNDRCHVSIESLQRIVQREIINNNITTQQQFESSVIIQIASIVLAEI
jgi:uncharacterized membrane protein